MTVAGRILALVIVLVAASPSGARAAEAPHAGPVAVVPFKNLGGEAGLDWLRTGIAETMVTDLRKSGRVEVVERLQVERAIGEVLKSVAAAESTEEAAKVGRMVGAKTIVLGSYQVAGKGAKAALRINARFVDVESGVVKETAKATGPLSDVFALQDRIVDRLLGIATTKDDEPRVAAPRPGRPKRKRTPKAVEAYRLYAMSLEPTATDAARVGLLRDSVAADPELVYALEDLAALESRMAALARVASVKLAERDRAALAKVLDAARPGPERANEARGLLDSLRNERRYHALVQVARQIRPLSLPPIQPGNVATADYAAFHEIFAFHGLRKGDLVLQLGEAYLRDFPTGLSFRGVEGLMNDVIRKRREHARRLPELEADLAEKRADILDGGTTVPPDRQVEWDWAPCLVTRWTSMTTGRMVESCGAFAEKYAGSEDPDAKEWRIAARYNVIEALAAQGEFEKARPLAESLLRDSDEWDEALSALMQTWPTD